MSTFRERRDLSGITLHMKNGETKFIPCDWVHETTSPGFRGGKDHVLTWSTAREAKP